jgi:L-cysteine desulfidase
MVFSDYLDAEWIPALGCTEPASIALAAATAASQAEGEVRSVEVICDPRIYKNCYAVGIPFSGQKVGIRWAARQVCGGVYARMSGADYLVMSLAGSGNKGITATVPLVLWADYLGVDRERMQEALALAALMTSVTTWHLGTLSAMCGCANAAGIGLAAGRVCLEGAEEPSITRAINNMVGNVAGMICDGAKIGCGMKALTTVDAASRSAELALAGMGIPGSDGIVGAGSRESLVNLGRIAQQGMATTDGEILAIMRAKLLQGNQEG